MGWRCVYNPNKRLSTEDTEYTNNIKKMDNIVGAGFPRPGRENRAPTIIGQGLLGEASWWQQESVMPICSRRWRSLVCRSALVCARFASAIASWCGVIILTAFRGMTRSGLFGLTPPMRFSTTMSVNISSTFRARRFMTAIRKSGCVNSFMERIYGRANKHHGAQKACGKEDVVCYVNQL